MQQQQWVAGGGGICHLTNAIFMNVRIVRCASQIRSDKVLPDLIRGKTSRNGLDRMHPQQCPLNDNVRANEVHPRFGTKSENYLIFVKINK